jgi:hypothetical protein
MGIYYEDLYTLVKPLHEHEHNKKGAANGHEVSEPTTAKDSSEFLRPARRVS